jgi:hypothetical protein
MNIAIELYIVCINYERTMEFYRGKQNYDQRTEDSSKQNYDRAADVNSSGPGKQNYDRVGPDKTVL